MNHVFPALGKHEVMNHSEFLAINKLTPAMGGWRKCCGSVSDLGRTNSVGIEKAPGSHLNY